MLCKEGCFLELVRLTAYFLIDSSLHIPIFKILIYKEVHSNVKMYTNQLKTITSVRYEFGKYISGRQTNPEHLLI